MDSLKNLHATEAVAYLEEALRLLKCGRIRHQSVQTSAQMAQQATAHLLKLEGIFEAETANE